VTYGTVGVNELALLSGLTQLTSLQFKYAGAVDADMVTPLAALPSLQQLGVAGLFQGQVDALKAAANAGELPCLKEVNVIAGSVLME
jgi:hypothetical protein